VTDLLDPREQVLRGYGEVMSLVQFWEQALEVVWWRTQRKHQNRPTGEFDTERSQREVIRFERALQKMTVQMIADAIAPHLEPKTAGGLENLADERNRLAHRFLLQQAEVESDGDFKPGTHKELLHLGQRFMASLSSVMGTVASFESYDGPVPAHWSPIAARIVKRAFSGQAIPRDPRLQ
jgi:hypothetical protein